MILDAERQEILTMASRDAIRGRLLTTYRSLTVALIAGVDLTQQGVRSGGPEEMLTLLGLRSPLRHLTEAEVSSWRQADPRYEALYQEYLSTVGAGDV